MYEYSTVGAIDFYRSIIGIMQLFHLELIRLTYCTLLIFLISPKMGMYTTETNEQLFLYHIVNLITPS